MSEQAIHHDGRQRVQVEALTPGSAVDPYPVKRIVGLRVEVAADIVADGHDVLAARLLYRRSTSETWSASSMTLQQNDRWSGSFTPSELGRWLFTVEAWVDRFATWRRGLSRKVEAGIDVSLELDEGSALVAAAATLAAGASAVLLRELAAALATGEMSARVAAALDSKLLALMAEHPDRGHATRYPHAREIVADPKLAEFSSWYELFPRSAGEGGKHGTIADVIDRLPYVAQMGFDILYLPPIHPIGRTHRKGPDNSPTAQPGDPGSPWAVGAAEGGHDAVHPELGTVADLERLVREARELGIEVALDIAFQASPDHPWVKSHPEWFLKRSDGSIQYAENPPKKYQDIYPFDFESSDWQSLWAALRDVFLYWAERGVRVFRVDNPHTKPIPFWRFCIASVKERHPEALFLAEAFTRPKLMYALAKAGFSQSYTYFTWRVTGPELTAYMTELCSEVSDFMRPSFWPNTPDILPLHLQQAARPQFASRAVLAATLTASYGIYGPAFELMVGDARPGAEEYAASEKYEIKQWDWDREDSLSHLLARLNRIRREHVALQSNRGLVFHATSNELMLAYSKRDEASGDTILVVVNLDPHHKHSAWVDLDLPALDVSPDRPFQVHDLVSGARYTWQGARNYVELDPHTMPASVFAIRRLLRSESSFEYYL